MAGKSRFSEQDHLEMRRLYEGGLTTTQIGYKFGIDRSTVCGFIRAAGGTMLRKVGRHNSEVKDPAPFGSIEKAWRLAVKGRSFAEIAIQLGISESEAREQCEAYRARIIKLRGNSQ